MQLSPELALLADILKERERGLIALSENQHAFFKEALHRQFDELHDATEKVKAAAKAAAKATAVQESSQTVLWKSLEKVTPSVRPEVDESEEPSPLKEGRQRRVSSSEGNVSGSPMATPLRWLSQKDESEQDSADIFARKVDRFAGVLVFLSTVVMLMQMELEGQVQGAMMGEGDVMFEDSSVLLSLPSRFVDVAFNGLFVLEFGLQMLANGIAYFKRPSTIYDVLVALGSAADLVMMMAGGMNDSAGRHVMRAVHALRVIRFLKALQWFSGIHLLLRACESFVSSLFWAMVVLMIFMVAGSLMTGNLLYLFVTDDSQELEDRIWIWQRYGTSYRACYSFFEITFAGSWPAQTRPVLDKVSQFFSIIFFAYITVVVFALIRVITAIFLKDTLDAAQNDADLQMAQNMATRELYVRKLEEIFQAIDEGGDGMITESRLVNIMTNPKVKAYFQTLDVDVHESTALFRILDDGDGEVTMDEFINGILRCKGAARAIDQVALHAEVRLLDKKVSKLMIFCGQMAGNSWNEQGNSHSREKMMKVFRQAGAVSRNFDARVTTPTPHGSSDALL